jgi:16S rRNA (guanine527-N7)-methyltransferase
MPSFSEILSEYCTAKNIVLNEKTLDLLGAYYEISLKWGEKINLTANLLLRDFVIENILDPVLSYHAYCSHIECSSKSRDIIDLGAGGGYLGIVWHILSDGMFNTVLIDSDRKKINFCKQVIRELGLERISAVQMRIEDVASVYVSDLCVMRATLNAGDFFRLSSPILKEGGNSVLLLSSNQEHEVKNSHSVSYQLPTGIKRKILIIKKQ